MALSGSVNTSSYDGRYYQVSWTATQSVANNQSTISWTLKALGGSDSWYAERTLKVVVAGTTVYTKTARVERYTGTISSGTVTVTHDSVGAKSFSISIQAAVYYSTVNCTGSASFALNTIPRKSSLSVGNGTLGTAQTLTVTRQSTSFTHTIVAKCGSASTTICMKSSTTSISFTPPISWASQNTSGTTVSVTYTITTYNGETSVGSNSYTKTCSIPTSVVPSCTVAVSDSTGYASTYGNPIKGLSTLKVVVTPTLAYDSPIASYSTKVNGATYTSASFTTGVLRSSGTMTVSATVKDKRGRSGSNSTSVTVLDYTAPAISKLSVLRCNSDGTENDQGEWIKVTFSGNVSSLNNKNTAKYVLEYKKSSDESYSTADTSNLNNSYTVTESEIIFEAETGSSYNLRLTVTDNFGSTSKTTVASTAFSLMHFNANGTGIGFGKISELSNTADFGMDAKFNGYVYGNAYGLAELPAVSSNSDINTYLETGCYGIHSNAIARTLTNLPIPYAGRLVVSYSLGQEASTTGYVYIEQKYIPYSSSYPSYVRSITKPGSSAGYIYGKWSYEIKGYSALSTGVNFNNVTVVGQYPILSAQTSGYINCPLSSGTGLLEVFSLGVDGQLLQRVTGCSKTNPLKFERFYYQETWGNWINTDDWNGKILATPGMYMSGGHKVALSEPISEQSHGIVLVFSAYSDGVQDYNFNSFFISKAFVSEKAGYGSTFTMSSSKFGNIATKYLYIGNTSITGHADNILTGTSNGITYANNAYVLRYVIGV